MLPLLPILARSDDDPWIKIVFGVIAVVIWLGGALIGAINKRIAENKRRQQYGRLPDDVTRPVPAPPPPAQQRGRPQKRRPAPPARPAPAITTTFARPALAPPTVSEARTSPKPSKAATALPSQIGRLLRRPDSLRAALILNEVLSPPLSIRGGHNGRREVE